MEESQLVDLVTKIKLFEGVSKDNISKLTEFSEKRQFAAYEYLFKDGDPSTEMILILKGEFQVVKGKATLSHLKELDVVGEMGILTNEPRSADVMAISDSTGLAIPGEALIKLLDSDHEMAYQIYKNSTKILCDFVRSNNFLIETFEKGMRN